MKWHIYKTVSIWIVGTRGWPRIPVSHVFLEFEAARQFVWEQLRKSA